MPRHARHVDRRRAAGAEGHGELRAAVRPGQAVRRRTANAWLDAAVGGWSLNMTGRVQSGSILNFGNVRVVGMSIDELAGRVQDPHRPGDQDRLHAAAGHHRQHDQGVQHERHVGDRLRRARRAERPLPGAGQRSRLHPGRARRLRAARRLRRGADLHALRPERQEALRLRRHAQLRPRRGRVESLQRHQLHRAWRRPGSGATINQVTGAYQDPNVTFDPGGRLMQLVFRLNF